jgi:hypothetical protein
MNPQRGKGKEQLTQKRGLWQKRGLTQQSKRKRSKKNTY